MARTILNLTNNKDQNSVAPEMPVTLTVAYAVIVTCVIETCMVLCMHLNQWCCELIIVQILLRAACPLLAIAPR